MIRTALLSAALSLAAVSPALPEDDAAREPVPNNPASVSADYSGYLLGIKMLNTRIDASFGEGAYRSEAEFKTAGLLRWFNEAEIEARVNGQTDRSYLKPSDYWHVNGASSKNREIAITFTGDDVISDVTPEFGSMGQPPATREERLQATDALSGILQLALNAGRYQDRPCGYGAQVFDGKQRYDLRVIHKEDIDRVKLRGYQGPVIACYVYYVPVSGFDPEDLPNEKERNTPLEVWFADTPDYGVFMPVRFQLQLDFGRAVLEVRELTVNPPTQTADAR